MDADSASAEDREILHKLMRRSDLRSIFDGYDPARPLSKEEEMLRAVLTNVPAGEPERTLAAIDRFGWEHWMMNLGDGVKRDKLVELVRALPEGAVVVELGGYVGYSATLLATNAPSKSKVYSIEKHPLCLAIATTVLAHSGLQHKANVLLGTLTEQIDNLKERIRKDFPGRAPRIDLLFLDHAKEAYASDFVRIKAAGLAPRVVAADNVIYPGAPDYISMIRADPQYERSEIFKGALEYVSAEERAVGLIEDGLMVSYRVANEP
ncbi:Catechol O-methyltransferase [Porphyridium purpureum]|uniref:catechol O-methyltransferase n=1 Tax=Porphyridium purpureum TaxID=35688 RepID=A0A5J4ZBA5_PORPP|nr:Catechol O-methyltransferase [Porphyridium purpureum]|eukprot:POR9072..scf295_1